MQVGFNNSLQDKMLSSLQWNAMTGKQLCFDAKSRDNCFDLLSVHVCESNGKGKNVSVHVKKMYGNVVVQLHSILISKLDRHELSALRSGRSNSRERNGRTKHGGNAISRKYASSTGIGIAQLV
jgi:hypothetical protein